MHNFLLLEIRRQRKTKHMAQNKERRTMKIRPSANVMETNNDKMEGNVVEEEVAVLPGKIKMLCTKVLHSSPTREEVQKQTVECTIMSSVLCECYPVIDEGTNPWAKPCTLLHDPKLGALRNHEIPVGSTKHYCAKVKLLNDFSP